jgi:hypothetical protein
LTVGAVPIEPNTIRVAANITANTTWVTGKTYILGARVFVTSGAKLTIQKGVIVKGEAGSGLNATSLVIARGAQIDAQGTATEPAGPGQPRRRGGPRRPWAGGHDLF